jgi:hypothetical protein
MAFRTNNSERMRITSGGAVLINQTTSVSTHLLTVNGRIGGAGFSDSYLQFTGGNTLLKANDDVKLGFTQNIVIKQSGSVGIGTASPNVKTHIFGGSDSQENVMLKVQSNGVANDGSLSTSILLANSTGLTSIHGAKISAIRTSSSTDDLIFSVFSTSMQERMRLDSSGRVLIGQSSNTGGGNANNLVVGTGTGNEGISIFSGADSGGSLHFMDAGANDDGFISYNHPNQFMQFGTQASEKMRITSAGLVGIGTTSPTYKLEVSDDTDGTVNLLMLRNSDSTYSQTWGFQLDTNKDLVITGSSGSGGLKFVTGSRGATFEGDLTTKGNAELGDNFADAHTINGKVNNITNDAEGYSLSRRNGGTQLLISANGDSQVTFGTDDASGNNTDKWAIGKDNTDNSFRIASGGTLGTGDKFTLTTTQATFAGDVTINSTTSTLNLIGSNTGASLINFGDSDDGNVGRIYYDHSNNFMQFKTNDSEKMRLDHSGNLGIGTASPGRKLTVTGDVSGDANNLLIANENDTDGDSASIGFSMLSNDTFVKAGIFFKRTTTQGRGDLIFATNDEVNGNNVTLSNARMTINRSGNVGIGTASPVNKLSIVGSANTGMNIQAGTSNIAYLDFGDSDDTNFGGINYNNADDTLNLRAGNTNKLTITSSGNVGIGTTSPNNPAGNVSLHISGTTGSELILERDDNGVVADDFIGGLAFLNSDASNTPPHYLGITARATNEFGASRLEFFSSFEQYPSGTADMILNESGHLGIGTSSPGANLQIGSATHAPNSNLTNNLLQIKSPSGFGYITIGNGDTANSTSYIGGASGLTVFGTVTDAGVQTEHMRIFNDGTVGIGTTSPSAKLHIIDTTNPATTSGSLIVEGRRDGGANVLSLRAKDASNPSDALPNGQGAVMRFQGFDGTDFENMGYIFTGADGQAVANGDAPSFMAFGTSADGSSSPTERMRIRSTGVVEVNSQGGADALERHQTFTMNCTAGNSGVSKAFVTIGDTCSLDFHVIVKDSADATNVGVMRGNVSVANDTADVDSMSSSFSGNVTGISAGYSSTTNTLTLTCTYALSTPVVFIAVNGISNTTLARSGDCSP